MMFDSKGRKGLAEGTGNPAHPKIAVIIANKLLFVADSKASITTGVVSVFLDGYSGEEMQQICNSVNEKR